MFNEFAITFIKTLFMNICVNYASIKIINYKELDNRIKMISIFASILIAIIYSIIYYYFVYFLNNIWSNLLCYIVCSYIFSLIIKLEYTSWVVLLPIAISFGLISFIIAASLIFLISKITGLNIINSGIIEYFSIGIFQSILIYGFFKIKRFKNGFLCFKRNNIKNYTTLIGIIISISTVIICAIYVLYSNYIFRTLLVIDICILSFFMFYWIKRSITKQYKERMKDRTVELQAEQLKQKDEIIKNLKQELSDVLKINHKYNHRLSAMELAVSKFGDKISLNEEYANEYADILDTINNLSNEYKQELKLINSSYNLPKTNIFAIDNLLEYMKGQANKENIEFIFETDKNVKGILENIPEGKLETLLADHIKDGIIAINFSETNNKKIKVSIGKIDKFYEVCIYDTGIEFEIDTLLKLGLENVTTHKETGGTGIGFATTFETLKECKGSLIIEEYNKDSEYSKCIRVIFDGENKFKIKSYRADEIKKKNKGDRIIIENI